MCFCSALSQNPVWWLMEGPRTITHDFSKSCCEANIHLVIHNSSEHNVSVRVVTSDRMPDQNQAAPLNESASSQGGWYDVSLENDIKAISSTKGTQAQKQSSESISPFVWCSLSSAKVDLKPDSCAKIPLKVCIFAPGTYNFSNYELHWKVDPSEGGQVDENVRSGGGQGYPFYVTVLQGAWRITMLGKKATFLWSSEHKTSTHFSAESCLLTVEWRCMTPPTQTSGCWQAESRCTF